MFDISFFFDVFFYMAHTMKIKPRTFRSFVRPVYDERDKNENINFDAISLDVF